MTQTITTTWKAWKMTNVTKPNKVRFPTEVTKCHGQACPLGVHETVRLRSNKLIQS